MTHVDRIDDVTGWGARDIRKSFAWESNSDMHDASEDWLHLRVGDVENVDILSDTILIGTVFIDNIIIAANDFVLRETCLMFD